MIPVQATRLLDEARRHKQAQQFHRREARRRMEELERFCRAHGIAFEEIMCSRPRGEDLSLSLPHPVAGTER